MNCRSCGHDNPDGAKFCLECGTAFVARCSGCGTELPAAAKFCMECGTKLQGVAGLGGDGVRGVTSGNRGQPLTSNPETHGPSASGGARKIVSILFADLVGSTGLHERLDPESARRFMESYYAAARTAVESHSGTVTQFLGDGVKAVFGIPRVAEDDAIRAVRAGVAMQDAFRALAEQQRAVVGETGLRVAVNTGEVVAKGETEIIGDPVNVAARLQERGRNGDVVIGESTQRLVASQVTLELLGSFDLKGRAEAVKAYRVVSLDAPRRTAATAFVGREEELARITAVFDEAVVTPATRLAVLLGSPGLGKSRLIGEFARRIGEAATVVAAHCDAAGGATFAPLADALRELLADGGNGDHLPLLNGTVDKREATLRRAQGGRSKSFEINLPTAQAELVEASFRIESTVSPKEGRNDGALRAAVEAAISGENTERVRIANGIMGILAGAPGAPEETFFVVRRFLAGLAKKRPVVLMIDDLQWAEPLLLDLVEHLVQWGRGLPLLVLIGARPELREVRSSFAIPGGLVADVVTLSGLDAGIAMRLAAGVIGATDLPAAVAAKVLATSEGNPLFIGELVRMLVDEGALIRDGDRWKTGEALATVEMPPTIHALLAARIERLEPQQCTVLERAAVVGRQFSRSAVAGLLPSDRNGLDAQLESLQRAQLIERDTGWLLGEPVLRFHHVLIRDAAYRRLLKGTRAELHERLANWIEEKVGDAPEHDETVGRHLEEAHRLLGELGPIDDAGQRLGERAATRLAAAGRRALEGDDIPLAAGLLGRALDRLNADDPARADLALDWCESLLAAGDVTGAAAAIDELGRLAGGKGLGGCGVTGLGVEEGGEATSALSPQSSVLSPAAIGRLRAWHTCFVGHHTVLTAPEELSATVDLVAAAANSLASLDDAAGEAKAHFVHALALSRLGRVGACEASLDQALAAARRAGDRRRANTVLAIAPLAALWGPSPVTRASGRCLDVVRVLRITQGAPAVEAVALSCQGVLEALRGRTEAAHRMIASGRKMVEELGIAQRLFEADVFAGFVALLEDDVPAAEQALRGAYDGLRDLGLGIDAARAAALLARALLAQNRSDEAEALSHDSEALAGDDLKAAIAWRGVRAEALAKRGEHTEAIELAQAAVTLAAATDALLDHADARLALAAALRAAGRGGEADAEDRHATELWEAKGATLLAERARRDGRAVEAAESTHVSLPSRTSTAETVRRRVRPNAASRLMLDLEAGFAARDRSAIEALLSEQLHAVEHPTGSTYGRQGQIESIERMLCLPNLELRIELLATFGDSLCLGRRSFTASATAGGRFEIAEWERDNLVLFEIDAQRRFRRLETFAPDRMSDALARLYERYADLLSDGPHRVRAAAAARSFAIVAAPHPDFDRWATALSPKIEYRDHRRLGTAAGRGPEKLLRGLRAFSDLTTNLVHTLQDVLVASPSAVVTRNTFCGLDRTTGGEFELPFLTVGMFDEAGGIGFWEWFDTDREAEGLARFDRLTAASDGRLPTRGPARRRVRANRASATWDRFGAAVHARDAASLAATMSDTLVFPHHSTGTTFDKAGAMATWLGGFQAEHLAYEVELLATLGESLALGRQRISLSGLAGRDFENFGPAQMDALLVVEDIGTGFQRAEEFAPDRLGDAIVRLYELYAAQQPEGSARTRLEAAAHAVSTINGPVDLEGMTGAYVPSLHLADHRVLATWSCDSAAELTNNFRHQLELATDFAARIDDVLVLETDALLAHVTYFGTSRDSGGAFENRICVLYRFGDDGRIAWIDCYEAEHEAEALARFDEIAGEPPARIWNRADAFRDLVVHAWHARDWPAIEGLLHEDFRFSDRRPLIRLDLDRSGWIQMSRRLGDMGSSHLSVETVATRGERLALWRVRIEVAGGDVGPSLLEHLNLFEANEACDRLVWAARFEVADVAAAYAELDARYEAGEAATPSTNWLSISGFVRAVERRDWDAVRALCRDEFVEQDHRGLAVLGGTEGADAWVDNFRTLVELAPDTVYRAHHVLEAERGYLVHGSWYGTREGGPYELQVNAVLELDDEGRFRRADIYDDAVADAAFARLAELGVDRPPIERGDHGGGDAGPPPSLRRWVPPFGKGGSGGILDPDHSEKSPSILLSQRGNSSSIGIHGENRPTREEGRSAQQRFANAARRAVDRGTAALAARDWEAFAALMAPGFRHYDRTRIAQLETDGREWLASTRRIVEMTSGTPVYQVLATRGERLALFEMLWRGAEGDVGPSEIEQRLIVEANEHEEHAAIVVYDPEGIDAAYAELDARFEAEQGGRLPASWTVLRRWVRAVADRDWEAVAALCSDGFVEHDHRSLSLLGVTQGVEPWIQVLRTVSDLAPDSVFRIHHFIPGARGYYEQGGFCGTREGGPFEIVLNALVEIDDHGLIARVDLYDDDRVFASSRWAEVGIPVPLEARESAGEARDTRHSLQKGSHRGGEVPGKGPPPAPLLGETVGKVGDTLRQAQGERKKPFENKTRTAQAELVEASLQTFPTVSCKEGEHALLIPPNQAVRATERLDQAFLANDLPAVRALFHPEFVFEDRGKKALVKGDVETLIESGQYLLSLPAVRLDLPRLATIGERITLQHEHWSNRGDGDAYAIDRVRLVEIDANGLFRAWILFDAEDRKSAFAEAQERFVTGEAASCDTQALWLVLHVAWGSQDWGALSALIADDAVIDDYRQLGFGRLGRDEWIESWRVGADLAPDVRFEVLRILVWNEHGRVQLSRVCGTRDGGEFENVLLNVFILDGGLLRYQEFFDVGDAERAVARFEELCAALEP